MKVKHTDHKLYPYLLRGLPLIDPIRFGRWTRPINRQPNNKQRLHLKYSKSCPNELSRLCWAPVVMGIVDIALALVRLVAPGA